ncbi:MAG: dihydroorotate oxidase, partial [archaeon]|nr:dihydroorotate oxidase [archaeon]
MNLSVSFKNINFGSPFMNASGPLCTYENELNALGESSSSAIVLKSMTFEARKGNERPKYFENNFGSINSNGLENLGCKEYCELIPKLKKFGKPIVASCVGFNVEEFETIIKALDS